MAKQKFEIRNINSLNDHPSQTLFPDLSDTELQELADDIERNGLQTPIEILADGTIICGHQRVRAYKLLELEKIKCCVRRDLEEQGEAAVERRLIEDNLHRRQLSKLEVARCFLRLKQTALRDGWEREDPTATLRDHLSKRFELGGKQIERYVRMLDAPVAVQQAFEARLLTQGEVLAVAAMSENDQQEIDEQIKSGADPKEAVKAFAARQKPQPRVETAVHCLVRALATAKMQLADRMDEVPGRRLERQVSELLNGVELLEMLHQHINSQIELESRDWLDDPDD